MQDEQQQATPTPDNTLASEQTAAPVEPQNDNPLSMTPPAPKKSKKSLLVAVVVLLLLASGVAAYVLLKGGKDDKAVNNSSTSTSKQTTAANPQEELLGKIKTAGLALNPSKTESSQENYVDNFTHFIAASEFISIAPTELYLDYKDDSATMLPKLATVLKDNGLSEEPAVAGVSAGVSKVYSNDKAVCNIDGTAYWTRMWCVTATSLKQAKDDVAGVLGAVTKHQGSEASKTSYAIYYSQSSDGTVKGAAYGDGMANNKKQYFVYKDNSWAYVTSSNVTQTTSAETILIDCKMLSDAKYKDVFVDYTVLTQNCAK